MRARAEAASSAPALLIEAVSRLSERAEDLAAAGAEQPEALETKLEALSRSALRVLDGADPGEAAADFSSEPRDIRLIHALRAEVLRPQDPPASPDAVLTVVRAIEGILGAVAGNDPEDLQALMAQPDAFQLLLEIAHDLRSPLTSILFLAETLRAEHSGALNDIQRSQLGLIYSAAFGLATITSDVMDLARDEQWWADQGSESYSVVDILQSVEEMVRPMADEKRIDLIVSPPHQHNDHAWGHPVALSRVLLNLTTNAIKFTDKGFVELGAKRSGRRRMEYYVRDSGRGMSPEVQERLFQPMKKRGGGDGKFFSGAGLGLSIARRILRSIGSDLQVESAPDWGTRFHFIVDALPLD